MKSAADSVLVTSRAKWRAWLKANHAKSSGAWAIFYKKGSGKPYVGYDSLVEEALCFGWIDSRPGKVDALRSKLFFCPRKPRSRWSKLNRERVARLTREKKMAPQGLAMVALAKKTGTWTALEKVEALEVPPDLRNALAKVPSASGYFEAFPPSVKRGILEWILSAKKPETRAKRIEETARLAGKNQRANQWPRV